MAKKYVVKLTMEEAEMCGIVKCANCGYPPNNHWTREPVKVKPPDSACAHAPCPSYKPLFRLGKAT